MTKRWFLPYLRWPQWIGVAILALTVGGAIAQAFLLGTVWPTGIYNPETGFDPGVAHPSSPAAAHWLGTDNIGRDVLSMILAGARPALIVAFTAFLVTVCVSLFHAFAQVAGQPLRSVGSMSTLASLMLPGVVLLGIVGSGDLKVVLQPMVLGALSGYLFGASAAGLVLATEARRISAATYVDASIASGGSLWWIFRFNHVPILAPQAVALGALSASWAVIIDGFLGFRGLVETRFGWGIMLEIGITFRSLTGSVAWHAILAPAVALSWVIAGLLLVAQLPATPQETAQSGSVDSVTG